MSNCERKEAKYGVREDRWWGVLGEKKEEERGGKNFLSKN